MRCVDTNPVARPYPRDNFWGVLNHRRDAGVVDINAAAVRSNWRVCQRPRKQVADVLP